MNKHVRFISYACIIASFLLPLSPLQASEGSIVEVNEQIIHKKVVKQDSYITTLRDELLVEIFSSLNQKNVPCVASTCKAWKNLMDDNHLWEGYAKRAFLMMDGHHLPNRDYKELIKSHCTWSFQDLSTLNDRRSRNAWWMNMYGLVFESRAREGAENIKARAVLWTQKSGMPLLWPKFRNTFSFTDLGILNGGNTKYPWCIKIDGSKIAGHTTYDVDDDNERASCWTQEEGTQPLGNLYDRIESSAQCMCMDGSVMAGRAKDADNNWRAVRWTSKLDMQYLGTLNGGSESAAYCMSWEGSVMAGKARDGVNDNHWRAFRWTQEKGMQSLGTLNGGFMSFASCMSSDGSVIAGIAGDGDEDDEDRAFRWTQEKGMQSLGTLNGGFMSFASCMSSDGSVIAGIARDGAEDDVDRSFRWTEETGIQSLGILEGESKSFARCMSMDGEVICGGTMHNIEYDESDEGCKDSAYLWTPKMGMVSVEQLLIANGVSLPTEWTLTAVTAITPSGTMLAGVAESTVKIGNNIQSRDHAWRAVIPRGNLF